MRKPFVAGNWKMHKTVAEARQLIADFVPMVREIESVDIVLCPPSTALMAARAMLEGTRIGLGAQNMHWEAQGAFTGELSAAMVAELGQYVILGHSERRSLFGETDQTVQHKIEAALNAGLRPIFCVGETLAENEAGMTTDIVRRQILEGLYGIKLQSADELIVAYEPVWAIGTGRAATADGANAVMGSAVRDTLATIYGSNVAEGIRLLYGGSVKANNAADFFKETHIDGALVGGACLKAEEFSAIVKAAIP